MTDTAETAPIEIRSVNEQRVEAALRVIARRWTTSMVQVLAPQQAPMRVCDIAAHLPSVANAYGLLNQMHADGLVTRSGDHTGISYQLSDRGRALSPVHRALFGWSWLHLPIRTTVYAERVEDAARRLHSRKSTAVVQALDELGTTSILSVAKKVGTVPGHASRRLERLRSDGLAARTGPHHGAPYKLTDAGGALGPVYSAVESWHEFPEWTPTQGR
ncbi:winged helix-turn-helix transcriptional regulator [Streptomyces sp. NPDC058471]|uniref:winged helix-turn-helix transcriptional regulator n=1 Tax=Streptomyces sp. NPDC058471 TaxID=3346516 RepID=UPI003668A7BC